MQANIKLQYILKVEFENIKKETNNKNFKLIIFKEKVDEFIKEIDDKGREYNWKYARKYKTPNNTEFLKWIEEFKSENLQAKEQYLTKTVNELADSKKTADNHSTENQPSL